MSVARDIVTGAGQTSWPHLAARVPRLADLLAEARAFRGPNPLAKWYGYGRCRRAGIKPRPVRLVGWFADRRDDPALADTSPFDTAYPAILAALLDRRSHRRGVAS